MLDRTREADLTELREYTQREDIENYEPVLREVLVLFGTAIQTSLERTMGKYELRRYIFEPDGLILQNYPVCTSNPIKVLTYDNVYRRILS